MRLSYLQMSGGKCCIVGFLLLAGGFAVDAEFGEKPDTPKLPEVPWVVHDGTRPQPKKVETKGCRPGAASGRCQGSF